MVELSLQPQENLIADEAAVLHQDEALLLRGDVVSLRLAPRLLSGRVVVCRARRRLGEILGGQGFQRSGGGRAERGIARAAAHASTA